jgi:tetratricopeptide (TPR) repeat protein
MKLLSLIFILFLATIARTQEGTDQQLAQYYYAAGQFEKALPYCQKLYAKENNKFNFTRYYDCLIALENEKEAEKLIKKQISTDRNNLEYPVLLGEFYENHDKAKDANKIYQDLITDYSTSTFTLLDLYKAFRNKGKYDLALQLLEKGRKSLKENYPLNIEFAEIYNITGQPEKMIEEYLNLIEIQANYAPSIQSVLTQRIDFSKEISPEYDLLKQKLLEKSQKKPNEFVYAEMLIWLFTQKKQFASALVQAQALDKREKGAGQRVYELGNMCVQNKVFDVARKCFKYVVDMGEENDLFYEAEFALLNTHFQEITQNRNYASEELTSTLNDYQATLNRVGKNRSSIRLISELAHIQAYYANQTLEAKNLLEEALKIPGITQIQEAELKMQLADILVLRDDIWEASLFYMQVDKDFKYEPIGFEAKFKNARIFYYDGDFKFAQNQLDVLKQSTSKLIANDAMKLSLLITDNYGLDSNFTAMSLFATADLLLEQHQYEKAFFLFDSIVKAFPYHGLADEILLRKGIAMENQGKWTEAVVFLEDLMKYHADDILADDALFHLGDIFENHLEDKEKAIESYKKILFDYKGSLYTTEARKRLRALRGDAIDPEDNL